jgi:hypothetical protein
MWNLERPTQLAKGFQYSFKLPLHLVIHTPVTQTLVPKVAKLPLPVTTAPAAGLKESRSLKLFHLVLGGTLQSKRHHYLHRRLLLSQKRLCPEITVSILSVPTQSSNKRLLTKASPPLCGFTPNKRPELTEVRMALLLWLERKALTFNTVCPFK